MNFSLSAQVPMPVIKTPDPSTVATSLLDLSNPPPVSPTLIQAPPDQTAIARTCKPGWYWDKVKKGCVPSPEAYARMAAASRAIASKQSAPPSCRPGWTWSTTQKGCVPGKEAYARMVSTSRPTPSTAPKLVSSYTKPSVPPMMSSEEPSRLVSPSVPPMMSSEEPETKPSSNTMYYVAGGIGILALLGITFVVMNKK